jgi:hypothetical protein
MVLCQFAHVSSFIHRFHFPLHHLVTAQLHTTALQIVSYIFLLMRCAGHHSQSICKRSCGSCSRGGIDPSTCHQHLWGKLKETTANMCKMHMWAHNMYVHTHIHARTQALSIVKVLLKMLIMFRFRQLA